MGNRFLKSTSKIDPYSGVHLQFTFSIDEARYWDKLAIVKAQATKVCSTGVKAYIVSASVIEDPLGEIF